ncbi:MAG: hypothetical protein UT81_C0021G0019 [Parcubacteria group bacterium GW2011_GWA2_40_14]|nr:MAG: hypothetical protein UT81_C0021G0019 [Parcubacteria group bacterium GW2011_GWA2_40_14]
MSFGEGWDVKSRPLFILLMKIQAITKKDKFLYGDFLKNKKAKTLVVFLSGLSGSRELPLFKSISTEFLKKGFSTVRFNFCTDSDDTYKKSDAFKTIDMSFSVYIKELKNIVDSLNYSKIVLIGHSFGAIIAMLFLKKYKKYAKNIKLVLWDPSRLPWPKKYVDMEKNLLKIMSKTLYNEVIRANSVKIFKSLNQKSCIISAKDGGDKDAKKYASQTKNRGATKLYVIKNTGHCFEGAKAQKELVEKTLSFIQ